MELVTSTDDAVKLRLYLTATDYTDSGTYHCTCCDPDFQYNQSAALLIFPPGCRTHARTHAYIIIILYIGILNGTAINQGDEAYNLTIDGTDNDSWSKMMEDATVWAVKHVSLVIAGGVCLLTVTIITLLLLCVLCQKCRWARKMDNNNYHMYSLMMLRRNNKSASKKQKTKKNKYSRLRNSGDKREEEAELMDDQVAVESDGTIAYSTSFINDPPPPPPLPSRPSPIPPPARIKPSKPSPTPSPSVAANVVPAHPPLPSRPVPPIPPSSNNPIPKPPPIPSRWK